MIQPLQSEAILQTNLTEPIMNNWTPQLAYEIHSQLEIPNWAPWLAASVDSIAGRPLVFEAGQILLSDPETKAPIASISTNQISWDGNPETLPSWDDIAGDPTTYEQTYSPGGNTLVLMSANVHPDYQGKGFGSQLIKYVLETAQEISTIEHVIGSFRPTGYGPYKAANYDAVPTFEEYAAMPAPTDKVKPIDTAIDWSAWGEHVPYDPWFRNLARNGMSPLKVDHTAMVVNITAQEFYHHQQTYKTDQWQQLPNGNWLCGEVGEFHPQEDGTFTYIEANLWGKLPFTPKNNE